MDTSSAIAIVGIGLRFPGACNKHEFWENLRNGVDSVATVSTEELLERGAWASDLAKPNYVRRVTRPSDVASFDAGFFSFTERQAQIADPQLRLLLEVCHEAAEDSGRVLSGTRTGVYVGVANNGHWLARLGHYRVIGKEPLLADRIYTGKDYFATQISHKLDPARPGASASVAACSRRSRPGSRKRRTHLLEAQVAISRIAGAWQKSIRGLRLFSIKKGRLFFLPNGYLFPAL